ncbi:MAG: hypothetical protein HC837_07690 [Chloroflexaceae bacterium]|nr:hypothetical protein [Chloroflexaceae bacterium]
MHHELAQKLLSIKEENLSELQLSSLSREIMQLFLENVSKTPANLNCYSHIEFGMVEYGHIGPDRVYGLKIKGKKVLLSEVMHVLETLPLPAEVRNRIPGITASEWEAVIRMVTEVLASLEVEQRTREV